MTFIAISAIAAFLIISFLISIMFRVVVSTNDVHIVQSAHKTVSYGKDQAAGNVYYGWPSWVPKFGVKVIQLPVSVFDVHLMRYAAYDKGRVPFAVDILAFFRIEDSNVAAQRVSSFDELKQQLEGILQGASRSIMAQSPIEEILEERAKYGQMFTEATNEQLKAWGVANVKNIELMDIDDAPGSAVIKNIMAIKQSQIERESRVQVAANKQAAQTAEIEADREVSLRQQEALQQVGIRTAQKEQEVGISNEKAQQAIMEQAAVTAAKTMEVQKVNQVRAAEIDRDVKVVEADRDKQTKIIQADGEKQQTITVAEGNLEQSKLEAEGIVVKGQAEGAAQQAVLMAPVNTQITLAHEIGTNEGYQKYLVDIRQIEANQVVGLEQAKALQAADIKVIATAGAPSDGLKTVASFFGPHGGTQIGAALEAFGNTPIGKLILEQIGKEQKSA